MCKCLIGKSTKKLPITCSKHFFFYPDIAIFPSDEDIKKESQTAKFETLLYTLRDSNPRPTD